MRFFMNEWSYKAIKLVIKSANFHAVLWAVWLVVFINAVRWW